MPLITHDGYTSLLCISTRCGNEERASGSHAPRGNPYLARCAERRTEKPRPDRHSHAERGNEEARLTPAQSTGARDEKDPMEPGTPRNFWFPRAATEPIPGPMRRTAHEETQARYAFPRGAWERGSPAHARAEHGSEGREKPDGTRHTPELLVPTRSNGTHTWPDAQNGARRNPGSICIPTRSVGTRNPGSRPRRARKREKTPRRRGNPQKPKNPISPHIT